jgi:hypothetical protein
MFAQVAGHAGGRLRRLDAQRAFDLQRVQHQSGERRRKGQARAALHHQRQQAEIHVAIRYAGVGRAHEGRRQTGAAELRPVEAVRVGGQFRGHIIGQAAGVAQQRAQRDAFYGSRGFRQVRGEGVSQPQVAARHQPQHSQGRRQLGDGGNWKEAVRRQCAAIGIAAEGVNGWLLCAAAGGQQQPRQAMLGNECLDCDKRIRG